MECSPPEKVDVQMRNGFPCIGAIVNDQTVASRSYPAAIRDLGDSGEHPTEQLGIVTRSLVDPWDAPLWDDQYVDRRLRLDIPERDKIRSLEDDVGRNISSSDFFEDGHVRVKETS